MNDEQKAAMAKFLESLEANGASFIRCENGDVIFAFNRARVEEFIKTMDEAKENKIIVLVQAQANGGKVLSSVN